MIKSIFSALNGVFLVTLIMIIAPVPAQAQTGNDLCDLTKPLVIQASGFAKTVAFRNALAAVKESMGKDPLREYTAGFGKDSQGNVIVSPLHAGNSSNGQIPFLPNGFADLHNHPKNTPPSSGDLYGLLQKNKKWGSYDRRYVVTASGNMFVLAVIDSVAARAFLAKYPPQQVPGYSPLFPDALLNEYREMLHRDGLEEELVMSFMLEKYATGTVLLKQPADGEFALIRTVVLTKGKTTVFRRKTCL